MIILLENCEMFVTYLPSTITTNSDTHLLSNYFYFYSWYSNDCRVKISIKLKAAVDFYKKHKPRISIW